MVANRRRATTTMLMSYYHRRRRRRRRPAGRNEGEGYCGRFFADHGSRRLACWARTVRKQVPAVNMSQYPSIFFFNQRSVFLWELSIF